MSRALTFLSIGMVLIVSIWMQRVAVELLGPDSMMWAMIADVTWPVDGEAWAEEMYVAITVWFIWIIRIGAIAGGLYREFAKDNVTAARVSGGRPR